MGFSPVGAIVGLAVLAPNLLLAWLPPRVRLPAVRVPRLLEWLERTGQALCLVVPAITLPGELVWWWSAPALIALAGYYALWGRYLFTGRVGAALYRPWWAVPVPMAVFARVAMVVLPSCVLTTWACVPRRTHQKRRGCTRSISGSGADHGSSATPHRMRPVSGGLAGSE